MLPLFFFFFFAPLLLSLSSRCYTEWTKTRKRSFGSGDNGVIDGDNGVIDDNPVLQNPLTNTKSSAAEKQSTAPLLMLLCLQEGIFNLIFNKLSKNEAFKTKFR